MLRTMKIIRVFLIGTKQRQYVQKLNFRIANSNQQNMLFFFLHSTNIQVNILNLKRKLLIKKIKPTDSLKIVSRQNQNIQQEILSVLKYFIKQYNNPYPNTVFNNQYFELFRDNQQFQPQKESTHSLYVDGIPNDAQEREVARIKPLFSIDIFRPYPGFQRVRLIKKQTQKGREYLLCFVDFDDAFQATIVMQTLQGYRFDKNDKTGLKIYFANNPKQEKQNKK